MFTWNLQFVSKKRLQDTLTQLMVGEDDKDVLVRIHTAIHTAEEAVDLAACVKEIIPNAKILGTSTSAIISEGKLIHDQCLVSITQMDEGNVLVSRIPVKDADGQMVSAEALGSRITELLIRNNTKLLFTFSPEQYLDIDRFVELASAKIPGVQMLGGVVDWNDIIGNAGFVFDENSWSDQEMILAALSGDALECLADFTTGVQVVGELHEITKAQDRFIKEIDGKPAAEFIHEGIGEEVCKKAESGFYFPLAYCFDGIDVPFVYGYFGKNGIGTNHNVTPGRKIRRCFFYDRKIISDNRSMFGRIESFEKGETLFAYSCKDRSRIYPNSVRWELSAYENSNMSGCLTKGEISSAKGRTVFTSCAFVLASAGESPADQMMNPYVFTYTTPLVEDNQKLLGFLREAMLSSSQFADTVMKEGVSSFVSSCRQLLLYNEKAGIANEAALHMDIRLGGYDRLCIIDAPDQRSIRAAFPEPMIEKTHSHFVAECASFAKRKKYHAYLIKQWQIAVAVPSYMSSLEEFAEDIKLLLQQLLEAKDDYIPIIYVACIIDGCALETVKSVYDAARLEMIRKNTQFYICNGKTDDPDEKSLREKYRMVNIIKDALAHDGVIPYYQGIYDNKDQKIHHYEALMRLKDENGTIYSPYAFLEVARSYGLLYDSLSREMLRKVFDAFKDSEDKSVSINLGMRDIKNAELTRYIFSFLSTARHPENFIFEILENEDVNDYETILRFVDNIHRLGGKISIDDFGSGYSNLLHLVNIPADYLKIDGSIVRECCRNKASEGLIQLISTWNRINDRDSRIVAEFVENAEIQDKLVQYHIDYSQGYLFSKPAPEILDFKE